MNTTRTNSSPDSPSGKGLGQAGADTLSNLEIRRLRDQNGKYKFCLQTPEGKRFLDAGEVISNPTAVQRAAVDLGVSAFSAASKVALMKEVEALKGSDPCVTAHQPGFLFKSDNKSTYAYAYVDAGGRVYKCDGDDTLIIPEFEANHKLKRKGSKRKSLAALARFTRNQAIPQFILLYSLTPLVLPFLPTSHYVENAFLELFGSTTSAKSTLATTVAGSVWGGSQEKTHYFDEWNSTINQAESELPNFNATLMGRDESTQQEGTAAERRTNMSNFIHRFSSESIKKRMGQAKAPTFRTMLITTSNDASTQELNESLAVVGGLNVRYLGFNVPDRETSFFDSFPEGINTLQDAIEEMHTNATENHGHVAKSMIKAILKSQAHDPDELSELIAKYMNEYFTCNRIEKSDAYRYRHLKPVALAYAAGRIAKDWNVLPEEHFGDFLKPMSRLLKYISVSNPKKASEEGLGFFLRYVRKNADKLHEVERRQSIVMSDKKFNGCLGLIGHSKDGRPFLAIPPNRMGKGSLEGYEPHLKLLKRQGHLVFDQGTLQTKVRLRTASKGADLRSDRVYKIMLPAWPLK